MDRSSKLFCSIATIAGALAIGAASNARPEVSDERDADTVNAPECDRIAKRQEFFRQRYIASGGALFAEQLPENRRRAPRNSAEVYRALRNQCRKMKRIGVPSESVLHRDCARNVIAVEELPQEFYIPPTEEPVRQIEEEVDPHRKIPMKEPDLERREDKREKCIDVPTAHTRMTLASLQSESPSLDLLDREFDELPVIRE